MNNSYDPANYPTGNPGDGQHFRPSDILLLVEHPDAPNRVEIDGLLQLLNTNSGPNTLLPQAMFSCPLTRTQRPFSMLRTRLQGDPDLDALVQHVAQLQEMAGPRQPTSDAHTLRVASPNWVLCGAPGISWGGSGARPVPVKQVAQRRHQFQLPPQLPLQPPHARHGEGVDVAILDTVPSAQALKAAYARWRAGHPLVESLLQSNGPLTRSYAPRNALPPNDYQLITPPGAPPYRMPDHGLFVAGIVHSLVPGATLQLVETLNPWGVGDMGRLLDVLYQFVKRRTNRPLVINCSLVLNLPHQQLRQKLISKEWTWSGVAAEATAAMLAPLEHVCAVLRDQGVLIVAAAGNDTPYNQSSSVSNGPEDTRYPAAFDSVLGVGALTRDGTPASYSNAADAPTTAGVATFGGAANGDQAQPEQGMLGVYTGSFTNGASNTNGWAWWAGTSFAAPVISGTLAALLSEGHAPAAALAKVQQVAQEATPTGVGPPFAVRQGG